MSNVQGAMCNGRPMKDSGVEWIGEIPQEWNLIKFKFVFSIIGGNGFPETLQGKIEGKYPFCKVSDINGNSAFVSTANNYVDEETVSVFKFNIIPLHSILMAKIGAALRKNHRKINEVPCCIDNNTQALVLKRADCVKYLYYLTLLINMEWFDNNSTVPSINNSKLLSFFVPDVRCSEQKRIADYLDRKCAEIDRVIADTQRTIEEYKALKQSIITEAVTKGVRGPRPMKDSGVEWIGEIPEEWIVRKGKWILRRLERPVEKDDGVITCFRDGEVTLRSNRREEGFTFSLQEAGYQGINPGDLVVHGMDGFAGAIGISDSRGKGTPVLNVLDSTQSKRYIMYYLRTMAYNGVFVALATGIRVRSCDTNWNKLKELPYPLPSFEEQEEIVQYIDNKLSEIDKVIISEQKLLADLELYKKSVIYEYVTGKKEVV